MVPLLLPALLLPLPSVDVLSSVLVCLGPLALIHFCCRFCLPHHRLPRMPLYFGLEPQPVTGFGSARASRLCFASSFCFLIFGFILAVILFFVFIVICFGAVLRRLLP